jgi:hypothetical protein
MTIMKARFLPFIWLVTLTVLLVTPNESVAMIYWRVSVKIILDSNGNRPTATNQFNFSTPQRIRQEFDAYNQLLDSMGWGFRIDLTEVIELGGVSEWFSVDARDGVNRTQLEVQAKLHPIQYAYRPNALNVYINNSSSGVSGGHLPLIGDVIFAGARGYWTLLLHEIGHGLGLCHTHGCDCNDNCTGISDNIGDTIGDSDTWSTRNQISIGNYSIVYTLLNGGQRRQVDDIWQNIMSYHGDDGTNLLNRLTHDQWERIVDVSNAEKFNIASGRTIFVDRNNGCFRPEDLAEPFKTLAQYVPGWSWGTRFGLGVTLSPLNPPPGAPALPCPPAPLPCSLTVCLGGPWKNIQDALNSAGSGDRLQIKAGNYGGTIRITKNITLATDRGTVAIGRP